MLVVEATLASLLCGYALAHKDSPAQQKSMSTFAMYLSIVISWTYKFEQEACISCRDPWFFILHTSSELLLCSSMARVSLWNMLTLLLMVAFAARSFSDDSKIVQFGGDDFPSSADPIRDLYEAWLLEHGKAYNGYSEKEYRFQIFKDNLKYINEQNSKNASYRLGLNKFADLTNSEFRAKYVGKFNRGPHRHGSNSRYQNLDGDVLPSSIDWRNFGAVNHIKDQGQCGSCWAFSAVAAVEGINFLVDRQLVSLSEQELVDCDTNQNSGCDGGVMDYAFQYIIDNGGLTTEANYPYQAHGATCNRNKEQNHAVTIDGFEDVPTKDEDALFKAVAHQPVSVAIEAGGQDFQFYSTGIFTGSCGTDLDHGVTAVGYGASEDGKRYWIVRNSWGSSWGESGYIRMEQIGQGAGLCGINLEASYPTKWLHSTFTA